MLRIRAFSALSQLSTNCLKKSLITTLLVLGLVVFASATWAADIYTLQPQYLPGESAEIEGTTFWSGETVTLQVTLLDGTVLSGQGGLPWTVTASGVGSFATTWTVEWDYAGLTLLITATGDQSGEMASTTFVAPQTSFNHLQNGTTTTPAEWANGNINGSNSCYSEGNAIPYRYFVHELDAGTKHFFTIEMEWTKAGIHALDYLVDYDFTEPTPISDAGGACGTISTTPPPGCSSPTASYPFNDFLNTTNYSGTIPFDFFTTVNPLFILDQAGDLQAYNVTIDSLGKYSFAGTPSDRTLGFIVYFTVDTTGSVGFFWGGHLAESNSDSWETGLGSSSVSGAPYHMRTESFDGGGVAGTDRSIQNSVICLPPSTGIVCGSDTVCNIGNYTYVCRDTASGANTWLWDVVNGAIVGPDNVDSVIFTVNGGLVSGTDSVYISVESCDSLSGCSGQLCCANDLVAIPVVDCNTPPSCELPSNGTYFVCGDTTFSFPVSATDPDGNLVGCSLITGDGSYDGSTWTFTTTGAGVYTAVFECSDDLGATCGGTVNITVTYNSPPVPTCPGNQTYTFLCEPEEICFGSGFTATDVDGNIESDTTNIGTLANSSVCFMPDDTDAVYMIIYTVTDSCGASAACTTLVNVHFQNNAPVCDLPSDGSYFVCGDTTFSFPVSATDQDGNLVGCSLTTGDGSYDGTNWTFTTTGPGVYSATFECSDDCGATCGGTVNITVNYNTAPTVTCGTDQTLLVCDLSDITISGFACDDIDDNLDSCSVDIGTLVGGDVTFTPVVGINVITLTATDACGATGSCPDTITVNLISPPTISNITYDTTLCTASDVCVSLPNLTGGRDPFSWTFDGRPVTDTVCFAVTNSGTISGTVVVTDSCGNSSTATLTLNATVQTPPTISNVTYDTTLCDVGDVCVSLPTVSGGTAPFSWTFDGRPVTDTVCFAVTSSGIVSGTVVVTDDCGNTGTATLTLNATVLTPPIISNVTYDTSLCLADDVCVSLPTVSGGTAPFSWTFDGRPVTDTVCFAVTSSGTVSGTVIVTDDCGNTSSATLTLNAHVNSGPDCVINIPTSVTGCDPAQVCYPVSATDVDDGDQLTCEKTSGPGTLANGMWCYTPTGDETVNLTFRCTDACGAFCEESFTINFDYNEPVDPFCPGYVLREIGDLGEICIPGFSSNDPDGTPVNCTVSGVPGAVLSGDEVCFTPPNYGTYTITMTCSDECGEYSCETIVDVVQVFDCPIIKIEKTHNTPQGQFETVSIFLENGTKQMGGFDFLIAYDASALTLVEAVPGQLLTDCEWEYFTYRFGAFGNCGDACPSGLLRIIALAETNNGPWHPSCYGPPDASGQYLLAEMSFYVSNDRTLNGMYVPIKFFWGDCGDNSIANIMGDTLYLDNAVYDFEGNLIWDEEDDDLFPEDDRIPFVGAIDFCMLGDKVFPVRCGEFWNGGIDIVHRDSIDAAGDLNMNGVANEIADAVMLTNYFISGLSAFGNHVEGSIAASDVNNDGTVLSVADLVYIVRIITGDAVPYPKPATYNLVRLNPVRNHDLLEIGYDSPMKNGAILLILNYQGEVGEPILGDVANGMDMIFSSDGSTMRILIYNIGTNSISSGQGQLVSIPIDGSINLVEAETSDYYGYVMETTVKSIPGTFALEQNYPNPFNPSTAIRMTLGESSPWSIAIYNVAGQKIREYQGYAEAGSVEVIWDGLDDSGEMVASGIYLYKATAGRFSGTRKMVLMK